MEAREHLEQALIELVKFEQSNDWYHFSLALEHLLNAIDKI